MRELYLILFLHYLTKGAVSELGLLENTVSTLLKPLRPLNADTVEEILDVFSPILPDQLSPVVDILKNSGVTATYNVKTTQYPTRQVYDFIVIGAGTAGAAVANRLSENENWNILLLEAGEEETLLNEIPLLYGLQHQTDYNYGYKVAPQKNACFGMKDQQCTWPRGKCLGGTSTLNAMIHTRGNKRDYDIWAEMGNDGWSFEDVLPYFIKSENFEVKDGPVVPSYHGTDGYVCVQNIPHRTNLATAFLQAGEELGYNITDINGPQQVGFSYLHVNMDHGARCSSARAYLRVDRPNLDIVTKAFVTRILFNDHKRAIGVEYVKNGQTRTVRTSKEVISSAGTVNGAQLLMLSGIGPKEHLEELGIPVIKDAKVGYNMYEHVATWGLIFTTNSTDALTLKEIINPENVLKYALNREGIFSMPAVAESIAFIKTKYAVIDRPDVEILFLSGSFHSDNGLTFKPSYGISDEHYNQYFKPLEFKRAWSVWPVLQHPKSVGRITLKSKDPFEAPILDPNFFSDPYDIEIILEAMKFTINLSRTDAFQRFDSQIYDKQLLGCELYEVGTDDYYRCVIKTLPVMENHQMGTAKMGPALDPDAVVDPKLRVYGVKGLRVIDASIMPTMTTGHINANVYMTGEKGADMVKKAWEGDSNDMEQAC